VLSGAVSNCVRVTACTGIFPEGRVSAGLLKKKSHMMRACSSRPPFVTMTGFFWSVSRESNDRVWAELVLLSSVDAITISTPVIRVENMIRFIGGAIPFNLFMDISCSRYRFRFTDFERCLHRRLGPAGTHGGNRPDHGA